MKKNCSVYLIKVFEKNKWMNAACDCASNVIFDQV